MNRWYVIGIIVLVAIIIAVLLYMFRDEIFGVKKGDASNEGYGGGGGTSIFPLKNGSFNLPEVGKLQSYLKSKGGTSCNGSTLIVDNDFGQNTECATKQILNVAEVSEQLYKSLGI